MKNPLVLWWGIWIAGTALVAASWLDWVSVTIGWIGFAIALVGFVAARISFLNRQQEPTQPDEDDATRPQ